MPHVVTQPCCGDASCVYACPVNCIQPTPDDPAFRAAEMLHIDPAACVDCGACVAACPVAAIKPAGELTDAEQPFLAINASYFRRRPARARPPLAPVPPRLQVRQGEPLRVAVVGSGPAGMYATEELLTVSGATVDVYERLHRPYGLARFGVAPDHRRTRQVISRFETIVASRRVRLHLGVEVGCDLGLRDLLASHHAVVYAVGAAAGRLPDLPGFGLPGSGTAATFLGWCSGHPEHLEDAFELDGERAIVIGNGNVALDAARILTTDPDALAGAEINPRALRALRGSRIREVIVVGRRGPGDASFTLPELVGLRAAAGVELLLDARELAGVEDPDRREDPDRLLKLSLLRRLHGSARPGERRIRLRFGLSPVRIEPDAAGRVARVCFRRSAGDAANPGAALEALEASLVLASIGHRGRPVPELAFDAESGTVPSRAGRVIDPASGRLRPGVYVTGWIKRGASGFIGTNRGCAQETIRALVEDYNAGRLAATGTGARRARAA